MAKGKGKNLIIGVQAGIIFLMMATEMFFLVRENRSLRVQIEELSHREAETIPLGNPCPGMPYILQDNKV